MKCTVCISLKCTNNLEIIARAADVLNVPFAMLVGYAEEPEIDVCDECYEILPEDVPMGGEAHMALIITEKANYKDVNVYLDLAIGLASNHGDSAVLKYAIKALSGKILTDNAKNLLHNVSCICRIFIHI